MFLSLQFRIITALNSQLEKVTVQIYRINFDNEQPQIGIHFETAGQPRSNMSMRMFSMDVLFSFSVEYFSIVAPWKIK